MTGYICSSKWMRKSYGRRPQDFRRRIISIIESCKDDLLDEEFRWLSLIKDEELGNKYYNLRKWASIKGTRSGYKHSEETRYKLSISHIGKKLTPESIEKEPPL